MRQIRVAHVATADISLRYMLLTQLVSLRQEGYDVTGISGSGHVVSEIESAGIRHIPAPFTRRPFAPLQDLRAFFSLLRIFKKERFDIVHTHTPKPSLFGQWAARLAGVPIIINTIHGYYFHQRTPSWLKHLFIWAEKMAAMCSDAIFFQNQEDMTAAVKYGIGTPNQFELLGNGIDLTAFDPNKIDPGVLAQKRHSLGIPDGVPVIGFAGRLVREKGLPELMKAASLVRAKVPDMRLLIVGPVDQVKPDAFTQRDAGRYGLADICHFAGMRTDMPYMYAMMNVLALPSHREGFPRAPMEASAMGIPSVVTDIRGCREVVDRDLTGFLVPIYDSTALARALVELLLNETRAQSMGRAARAMALNKFGEEVIFEKVKQKYRQLLEVHGPRLKGRPMQMAMID